MKVITLGKYGALGNNFFRFIHLLAFAKEHNAELYYSDRRNIDKFFKVEPSFVHNKKTPNILNSQLLRFALRHIVKSSIFLKLFNRFGIYLHDHIQLKLKDEQLKLALEDTNGVLIVLRDFRAHKSLEKYVDIIRRSFDIKPELTEAINLEYLEIRKQFKLLIGVHIRRGDYKEWRNGKYYFSDDVFANKINQFLDYNGLSHTEVGVVICSNGNPEIQNFKGMNVFFSIRPEEEDLFLMKRCDFILAPPSTFCSMSSFIGSVPLYFIEDNDTTSFAERLHVCSY